MASSSTIAFGQYLRTLRERRGLSLDDVATLSRTFADPVEKGYLSRCENGHQSLALSKMIALSRIYEVPAEVLVERLELDLEVEKAGVSVEATDFAVLTDDGMSALRSGSFWRAYHSFRSAMLYSSSAPLMPGFDTTVDQERCAIMNHGTAAASLGRYQLALHELEHIHSVGGLSDEYQGVLLERLSVAYRATGKADLAIKFADDAVRHASKSSSGARYHGIIYSSRARLAYEQDDLELALELYQRAYEFNKAANRQSDCGLSLQNIAQVYFRLGRLRAARRALAAVEAIAKPAGLNRMLAYSRILLGEIESAENRDDVAAHHWMDAIEIARRADDRIALFKAEYQLFRHAQRFGQAEKAGLLERRLRRRLVWLPNDISEAMEFKRSYPARRMARKRVASAQR